MDHKTFIRQSYALARRAVQNGNHPFGALLVSDGRVLLAAENTVHSDRDLTGHAELNLVRRAGMQLAAETFAESILYASTEPCVMCAGAIYWAGIRTVVFGCSAARLAEITGGELSLPCREVFARGRWPTNVIGPVLEEEGFRVHEDFWK